MLPPGSPVALPLSITCPTRLTDIPPPHSPYRIHTCIPPACQPPPHIPPTPVALRYRTCAAYCAIHIPPHISLPFTFLCAIALLAASTLPHTTSTFALLPLPPFKTPACLPFAACPTALCYCPIVPGQFSLGLSFPYLGPLGHSSVPIVFDRPRQLLCPSCVLDGTVYAPPPPCAPHPPPHHPPAPSYSVSQAYMPVRPSSLPPATHTLPRLRPALPHLPAPAATTTYCPHLPPPHEPLP